MTLERINNDGNYEPGNCRWASVYDQVRNMRRNIWVTLNGETLCLYDACRASGVLRQNVEYRMKRKGMKPQAAFDHYLMETSNVR